MHGGGLAIWEDKHSLIYVYVCMHVDKWANDSVSPQYLIRIKYSKNFEFDWVEIAIFAIFDDSKASK